jgi:hypothetical protein
MIRIPPEIIKLVEAEIQGLSHGSVTLTIHLRDYRPRFVIGRERSLLPDLFVTPEELLRREGKN